MSKLEIIANYFRQRNAAVEDLKILIVLIGVMLGTNIIIYLLLRAGSKPTGEGK